MDLPTEQDIKKAKAENEEFRKFNQWRRRVGERANTIMFLAMFVISIVMSIVVLWPKK